MPVHMTGGENGYDTGSINQRSANQVQQSSCQPARVKKWHPAGPSTLFQFILLLSTSYVPTPAWC